LDRVIFGAHEAAHQNREVGLRGSGISPALKLTGAGQMGNDSLVATGSDAWGYGIVAATCQVCSYRQSEHTAELENLNTEWELRWEHQ
jgi:hypothetical protein